MSANLRTQSTIQVDAATVHLDTGRQCYVDGVESAAIVTAPPNLTRVERADTIKLVKELGFSDIHWRTKPNP